MLREALTSFQKAKKYVNLMINIAASFYATTYLDHERLFEEITKIHRLAFNDLQTNANNENAPIARANHSLWPQTALPVLPTI
jgi:hypothetical protein